MCVNCSYHWRNKKTLGPLTFGWGQICEDRSSWIMWFRIFRLYFGVIPARCYWKRPELKRGVSNKNFVLGGGQARSYMTPPQTVLLAGPFDISWRH